MAEALHWDRTQLGTAYAIYQLMIGVPAPLIAVLIAKTGARFTTAIGCWIVVGGALLMSSIVHTSWQTYIFYSFMMGLGAMTGGILVAQTGDQSLVQSSTKVSPSPSSTPAPRSAASLRRGLSTK